MHPLKTLLILSLLMLLGIPHQLRANDIHAFWSTDIALPGERVLLFVVNEASQNNEFEIIERPRVQNASVQILPYRRLTKQNGTFGEPVTLLPLLITPDAAGKVRIKDLSLRYSQTGKDVKVPVPPLKVHSTSEIQWFNNPIPYGVLWDMSKKDPYVNESITARVKILLPQSTALAKLPTFTTSGLKIFPFQLSTQGLLYNIHQGILGNNMVPARRQLWRNYDLVTTIVPYREGKNEASGKCIVSRQVNLMFAEHEEILLPTLNIPALPLPPGAPAHFDKLVGDYDISVSSEAKKLAMNEAIDITLRVTSSGSLDDVICPRLIDDKGWKLVPASKKVESDVNGIPTAVIFHQLIRPTSEQSAIPAFRLSYFNPESQQYETAQSKPIVLPWEQSEATGVTQLHSASAASDPPPAGSVPVAELSDIYSLLPDEIEVIRKKYGPRYYLLFYIPSLFIALYLLIRALRQRRAKSSSQRELERELRQLQSIKEPLAFLRQSAAFVEKHLTESRSPELDELIARRDAEAFRRDADSELSPAERKGILTQLRRGIQRLSKKALPLLAFLLLLLTSAHELQALAVTSAQYDREGRRLYEEGQYSAARDAFQRGLDDSHNQGTISPARLYYHLGNSYYRLNQEGRAALAYARALEHTPSLKEAEANLAFIQRKQGAILAPSSTQGDIFTYFDADQLLFVSAISTAILLTCILLLFATSALSTLLKTLTVLSALSSLFCAVNWLYYMTLETPHISMLSPSQIAYVIKPAEARSSADAKGSSVIKLPPSTPVRILATRPSWYYIECMNGVRGWVSRADVEALAPAKAIK